MDARSGAAGRPRLAGPPRAATPVPRAVTSLAAGEPVTPVWRNELGGLTFRLGTSRYVKWVAHGTPELDLPAEADRLAWAAPFTPVPRVLEQGADDDGRWLVTAALRGRSAVEHDDPRRAAAAVGLGLRHLHDALPVARCPFTWSAAERLARARDRLATGRGGPWAPEHRDLPDPLAVLRDPPPVERPVVCHGDACMPNTLVDDDGGWLGHVDLGSLGVADPWADLAVAAWSTEWNLGPGYTGEVYAAYAVAPDRERIAYYRLLWDVG